MERRWKSQYFVLPLRGEVCLSTFKFDSFYFKFFIIILPLLNLDLVWNLFWLMEHYRKNTEAEG
jgi:hypothetical protein